jgi:NitT/TauT family transport system substrate-binding protein
VRSGASLGFVGAEGLSMRMASAASEDEVLQALRTGEADAAVVSSEQALSFASQGLDLRIVLLLTTVTSGELILADPAIADVPGLVGRRVAFAADTRGELLLRGTLAAQDVPVTEVALVDTGGLNPALSLVSGAADAATVDAVQAAAAGATDPAPVALATAGDQPGLLSHVLIVRAATAAAQPGQLLAFTRAWQVLYLYERDAVEEIAGGISRRRAVDIEVVLAELGGSEVYDVPANGVELFLGGRYYDYTLRQIRAAATASGWLEGPVDERGLIDGVFAQTIASQP